MLFCWHVQWSNSRLHQSQKPLSATSESCAGATLNHGIRNKVCVILLQPWQSDVGLFCLCPIPYLGSDVDSEGYSYPDAWALLVPLWPNLIASQDRSMWRTLRPSAGQAQQWVSECPMWLIHHFTSITFSVKSGFFHEKVLPPMKSVIFCKFKLIQFHFVKIQTLSYISMQILLFAVCQTSM